jgi:ribosomal protein L6P/L9E
MLWYGKIKITNFKRVYKRHNYRCNVFTKTLAFPILKNKGLSKIELLFYIPFNWNFIVLNSKKINSNVKIIYLFSSTYFFKLPVISNHLKCFYDKQTNTISISNQYNPTFYKFFFTLITNIFNSFSKSFFKKIKFKGKGYYIYKNKRNTITSQFGHAHRIYMYSYFISVKFLNKTTVFLFGSSKNDIVKVSFFIKNAKPINIFTGRGVRFAKQVVYKKTGKVSTYR